MGKTRGLVENTGRGKHGVWWKTRGVENTGSDGKHGVSVENTMSKCKTPFRLTMKSIFCYFKLQRKLMFYSARIEVYIGF